MPSPGAGSTSLENPAPNVHEDTQVFPWQECIIRSQKATEALHSKLFSRFYAAGTSGPGADDANGAIEGTLSSPSRRRCCYRPRDHLHALASTTLAENLRSCDRMHLLFKLENPDPVAEDVDTVVSEVLLCELRARAGGHWLEVQPPFHVPSSKDGGALPYRFSVLGGIWYEYSVENASHVPTEAERHRATE